MDAVQARAVMISYLEGALEFAEQMKNDLTAMYTDRAYQAAQRLRTEVPAGTPAPEVMGKLFEFTIEAAMKGDLTTLAWMDEPTRQKALAKLDKVFNKVGYPDHARNYDALVVGKDSYLANANAAEAFETNRDLSKIGKPLDHTDWVCVQPHFAIVEMLNHVVGRIADERLRVDH